MGSATVFRFLVDLVQLEIWSISWSSFSAMSLSISIVFWSILNFAQLLSIRGILFWNSLWKVVVWKLGVAWLVVFSTILNRRLLYCVFQSRLTVCYFTLFYTILLNFDCRVACIDTCISSMIWCTVLGDLFFIIFFFFVLLLSCQFNQLQVNVDF
jgi:hypothetical protein